MKKILLFPLIFIFAVMSACSADREELSHQLMNEDAVPVNASKSLNVALINLEGEKIGHARLSESPKGVEIELQAKGLEPGEKAIHVHETGKCEPPDFKSAGAHLNPHKREHGFDNPKGYHLGDLPNIMVSAEGEVSGLITAPSLSLEKGKENSILDEDGSALVIHAGPDDYKTDPAGNADDRIACAAIIESK